MIVVDASVAVKWLLPEPGSEQAAKLLIGTRKLVAAAVTRRARLGDLPAEDARQICAASVHAAIEFIGAR